MNQSETSHFDVVIIGAGPAGLSVASELSKTHRVAVIEKGTIGTTDRAWFVPGEVMAKQDEEVQKYTKGGIKRLIESTPTISLIWDVVCPWKSSDRWKTYPFIDQPGMLGHWAKKAKEQNALLLENCSFTDYNIENGIVTIRTIETCAPFTEREFTARLLIDASGFNSPVANRSNISRAGYRFWSVYGWELEFDDVTKLKHPKDLGNMAVGDFMLWNSFKTVPENPDAALADFRPIMEYEVLSDTKIFFFILYFHHEKASFDDMKNQFSNVMKNTEENAQFSGGKWTRERFGWFPSMGVSQQIAKDNISFIGDSGCWTTADGYGMSFILDNYKNYSKNISYLLNTSDLSAKQLNRATALNICQRYQLLMDQVVLDFMSFAPPKLIDKFTGVMFDLSKGGLVEKMFMLNITQRESLAVLFKMLVRFSPFELLGVVNAGMNKKLLVKLAVEFAKISVVNITRMILRKEPLPLGYTFKLIKGAENA